MIEVASRELRNNTRSVLERVKAGEAVTITLDGRPVAILQPVRQRSRWLGRGEFVHRIGAHQADPRIRQDLAVLAPESTDDLPTL
ncbi:MAG: type II toxin-antitoxin system prevent-host-death family antitoxin [Actinobacteria bacterium]|nr:type II toxin-antitoxin system prevent-host-death family antitoxin [Actinomycetota bacterium]